MKAENNTATRNEILFYEEKKGKISIAKNQCFVSNEKATLLCIHATCKATILALARSLTIDAKFVNTQREAITTFYYLVFHLHLLMNLRK